VGLDAKVAMLEKQLVRLAARRTASAEASFGKPHQGAMTFDG
jgi:hypothetical protein